MADYARGGYIAGPDDATDDVPFRISECEVLIGNDGTARRNGHIVGRLDMAAARALLDRINSDTSP